MHGRFNLYGDWEHAPANPEAPNKGGFSGNLDRGTGDFELLLWRQGLQTGELRGNIRQSGHAKGATNWGSKICWPKQGVRTSPS